MVQTWLVQIGLRPFHHTATVTLNDDGSWSCDCGQVGLPPESARGRNCEHLDHVKVQEAHKRVLKRKLELELEAKTEKAKLEAEMAQQQQTVVIRPKRKIHLEE